MTEYLIEHRHKEGRTFCIVACDFDLIAFMRDGAEAAKKLATFLEINYEPQLNEEILVMTTNSLWVCEFTQEEFEAGERG